MPRPQASIVLLDAPRLASVLTRLMECAQRRDSSMGDSMMGVRTFAAALGLSVTATRQLLRGERRFLRTSTSDQIFGLARRSAHRIEWPVARAILERAVALHSKAYEGSPPWDPDEVFGLFEWNEGQFGSPDLAEAWLSYEIGRERREVLRDLVACAAESWVLPDRTSPPLAMLAAETRTERDARLYAAAIIRLRGTNALDGDAAVTPGALATE